MTLLCLEMDMPVMESLACPAAKCNLCQGKHVKSCRMAMQSHMMLEPVTLRLSLRRPRAQLRRSCRQAKWPTLAQVFHAQAL